jgi:putative membrane protein
MSALSAHVILPALGASAGAASGWGPEALASHWSFEPAVIGGLAALAALIALAAARGRASRREILALSGGAVALVVALVSPLDALGGVLFTAHMAQHEILMLVAAPLIVLGRPGALTLRLAPPPAARAVLRATRPLHGLAALAGAPLVAWIGHALALWVGHAPPVFEAALERPWVHAAQHLVFLGSALVFWSAVIGHGPRRLSPIASAAFLFTTTLHAGLLGALLTFSTTLWYPAYLHTTVLWGWTPLEDQQLGGLLMWVPGCSLYMIVALARFAPVLRSRRAAAASLATGALLLMIAGCRSEDAKRAARLVGGDAALGRVAIERYGCGSCHTIPGVAGARSRVGPPLAGIAGRAYIAGVLVNDPDNMVRWLRDPPAVDSLTVMPRTGLTEVEARNVATYLYTLR